MGATTAELAGTVGELVGACAGVVLGAGVGALGAVSADGTMMNTGLRFFLVNPIYISYDPAGEGTAFID